MLSKAVTFAAGIGLTIGGLLAVGPVQADPPPNHNISLDPTRYFHTTESCAARGQQMVAAGWGSYDCVTIWNGSQTTFVYWLEKES
ncbi:hypothetical protein [Actinoplanes xinjiangensis]|uniref:Secreted protein n=1 Tax=Actinoplanes xinjiangensis TaxID=512350 RepID=A0A316E6S4_9ACTN|nr:hypothetical protein [Actinoplanes xinjiangensis]PWK26124.1 hypothetical protein BC793_1676 [Actinoplanes xinjiangensis]GIF45436.1 hypothetical protein Axi01nite_97470 [Actinoplanes xinjiangensis]